MQNLEMMEGRFCDEDALKSFEQPLMSTIASLLKKLRMTNINAFNHYEDRVRKMIHNMKSSRRSAHGTMPVRLHKHSEAVRNRQKKTTSSPRPSI